jgi:hypothetical protein
MVSRTSSKRIANLIGIRNALIGGLLFAIVQGIRLGMSSETDAMTETIRSNFSGLVFIVCISNVISIVPGYFGGGILERLRRKNDWDRRSLVIAGIALGIMAAVLINLPELLFALGGKNDPVFTGYITQYITRLVEALIIAGLMGGWSGYLIADS